MRSKVKVLLARLAYQGEHRAELATWTARAAAWAAHSPKIEEVLHCHIDCAPTPVARHKVVKTALEHGCDLIVSVDGDTLPHEQFFEFAVQFLMQQKAPCVLAAPYVCGGGGGGVHPGSEERVQVFRFRTDRTRDPNELPRLDHIPREEASYRTGVEAVACAGTGCFACHVDVFDHVKPPWFRYEYGSKFQTEVISTEDVAFFRDLVAAGLKLFVSWDHWVEAHYKVKAYIKPLAMSPDEVWERTDEILRKRQMWSPLRDPETAGWFDYPELYDDLVRRCRPGGTIVEVGSYTGVSFTHLAAAARTRGAGITCVSVDVGTGGTEPGFAEGVQKMGGTTAGHLARRILAAGLTEEVLQIVGTSERASRQFAGGTLDAVFLDADHDADAVAQDVAAWWPKLMPGGTLAGHDWDRASVREGLKRAGIGAVQSGLSPSCWEAIKPSIKITAYLIDPVTKERVLVDGTGRNGAHKKPARKRAKKGE